MGGLLRVLHFGTTCCVSWVVWVEITINQNTAYYHDYPYPITNCDNFACEETISDVSNKISVQSTSYNTDNKFSPF